jgi:hypothetical protein
LPQLFIKAFTDRAETKLDNSTVKFYHSFSS